VTAAQSALYVGRVIHQRLKPRRHRLRYRVFSVLIDLDELSSLDRRCRLFAHNRFAPLSFHDGDHGSGEGGPLRPWVLSCLEAAGVPGFPADAGPVRVLCYPRVFGYVFNPLSVYFCHRRGGELAAMLYEVNNTFGQRHCYLIPIGDGAGIDATTAIEQRCAKGFYVSPFIPISGSYQFKVRLPAESAYLVINHSDDTGYVLHASFEGRRVAFGDRAILRSLLTHPLMTLKVMAGIHWEALRLWLKGVPLVARPQPPAEPVTVISPEPR
jgi:DUF1365 family protein